MCPIHFPTVYSRLDLRPEVHVLHTYQIPPDAGLAEFPWTLTSKSPWGSSLFLNVLMMRSVDIEDFKAVKRPIVIFQTVAEGGGWVIGPCQQQILGLGPGRPGFAHPC